MEVLTAKLTSGVIVLAGRDKWGAVWSKTYANRTQAQRAADKVGGYVIQPLFSRVFYVTWESAEDAAMTRRYAGTPASRDPQTAD